MNNFNYYPDFFIPNDLSHAKHIILTPEDSTVDQRWDLETQWTVNIISALMNITPGSVVLDWGCGIGRISKALIDTFDCHVVGVDLQPKMLDYAKDYVNSNKFTAIEYKNIFTSFPKDKFTHVFSCWVFQHSNKIQFEIPLIYESMKENSDIFVLECLRKAIPHDQHGYYDDKISTRVLLEKFFDMNAIGTIPTHITTKKISEMSWWGILKKRSKLR